MKQFSKLSCTIFILALLTSPISFAQPKTDFFDGVTLLNELPKIFFPGETYTLKGAINDFSGETRISCELNKIDGAYRYKRSVLAKDSLFTIPLTFGEAGSYYMTLQAGRGRSSEPKVVFAALPQKIESADVLEIRNFRFEQTREKALLAWESENELIELRMTQAESDTLFLLTNQPGSFEFPETFFDNFSEEEIVFEIRGARSMDGGRYTLSSDWGEWQKISIHPAVRLADYIDRSVSFPTPFALSGPINQPVKIKANLRRNFSSEAFIRRPDGRVEVITLKCQNGPQKYRVGGLDKMLCTSGGCELTFTPDLVGAYIIEINDQDGKALLNAPFYCGEIAPVLPEKEITADSVTNVSAEREKMLNRVNALRTELGLRALRLDSTLIRLSQYYAGRMAKENFYGHVAPDGENIVNRKRKFSIKAEILENVGFAPSAEETQAALERSPAHYLAMIDSGVTRIGLGIAVGAGENVFVAQHFSPDTLTQAELESFLQEMIAEMKKLNPRIELVSEPGEWPSIGSDIHKTVPSLARLKSVIFIEDRLKRWKSKRVGKILVARFEQTVEGIFLTMKYYPYVKKPKKK